ncbi:MAG: NAD(P)(+) transhydrogenase (Re/Si-specific) subunit beta [Phycisphaerae bacterium]|nr:NAD(P)(+) transhydrogenase (Re/Si-specific) subunit beta [Phycisphaerae bacterium]
MSPAISNFAYLVGSVMFILALKRLSHPRTAVRGNLIGALGMLFAIIVTIKIAIDDPDIAGTGYWLIGIGLFVGSVIGALFAIRVPMTGMPQMVGLLNGFGGGASFFVAAAELVSKTNEPNWAAQADIRFFMGATFVAGLIGMLTLLGSLVAAGKLQDIKWVPNGDILPMQRVVNGLTFLLCVFAVVFAVYDPTKYWLFVPLTVLAAALGVMVTCPIGGADMPVVICLLNSYSGMAAAATGFVTQNDGLIIAGSLVGSSGIILCMIMCKAMNRSLTNVLFGKLGTSQSAGKGDDIYAGKIKAASAEEIAMLFDSARRVVIVPGYGLAVSQAQHAVRDLAGTLEAKGVEVEYGIHPVAGRMPGHMNVLLAEANIPYEKVREMDDINSTFEQTDVAIVIGANDVVNPAARTDPKSPIAGMPILDVDKARTVVVVKRSLSPGFAGIPNPLFAADNTLMYFADGKKAILDLVAAIKAG